MTYFVEQGSIDVANSVRSDSFNFTGQPPIVLARLPRVGAAPPVRTTPATMPPPEVMPQLDLRGEIDQRIRLHVADTSTDQVPATSRFADREHVAERGPTVRLPASETIGVSTASRQEGSAKPQAATLSEKMFQLHAQLAPHAGLIVALALIASAGLLYWMIVGPVQTPMPPSYENYSENFGPELRDEGLRATSNSMPDNYLPEFAIDLPQTTEPVGLSDQWTEMPLPVQLRPEFEPPALQELPSADESLYPKTKDHQALDFTKLRPQLPSNSVDVQQSLPEVARQPTTTTTR